MTRYKIVFAGAMGAGKTTAIHAISDTEPVSTDVANLDTSRHDKAMTTIGIDYGSVHIDDETEVVIYGTPGQERFEFVWKIVQQGALGTIIFVDHASSAPLDQVAYYVEHYLGNDPAARLILAITHVDESRGTSTEQYFQLMQQRGWQIPLFFVDARQRADVAMLINALIALIEAQLDT